MPRANPKYDQTLRNRQWIENQYVALKKSAGQIARELGTDKTQVLNYLRRFGLAVRSAEEARRLQSSDPRKYYETLYNKDWLLDHYVTRRLSARQIAEMVGCPTVKPVLTALKHQNIEIRSSAAQRKGSKRNSQYLNNDVSIKSPGLYALAREVCPPGPCVICGAMGHVHHKDHNIMNVAPSNLERLCKKHHQRQHNLEAHAAFRQLALSGRLTREESDLIQHSRGKSWMDNLITLAVKYQIPLISLYNKAHARMLKEFKANPTGGSCTFCEDWGDWFFKDGDSKNRSADNKIALCQVHKKAMREMMRKLVLHYADTHERPIQGQSLQQVIASLSLSYFKVFSKACVILKAKFGHAQ